MGCIPVTGYAPEDYDRNPHLWHTMVHPEDRPVVEKAIEAVLGGQKPSPLEHRIIRPDGSVVWVRNTIAPHFDSRGRLIEDDGLIENISKRKTIEMERERIIGQLQEALARVKQLSGLLPICASCKKIRDDQGYWQQIELYIRSHSDANFSHSICPDCKKRLYPELFQKTK